MSQADEISNGPNIGTSAAIISICTIISRITGFARTWAMAFALGATFLSSSYQVANNLPNMLYELVMGGMLTTAFLPVYMSIKRKMGRSYSRRYASNLLTIVVLLMGILSLLCILFPAQVIYTQTFFSNQEEMSTSVFFFQFFAVQLVFYGASSIISGLLNANRDYIWGAIAPVFNNLVVIVTFIAYAFVAPENPTLALYIIAIGNPAGVAIQLFIQLPGLRRNGIVLKPRIDFHDPGLGETIKLGVPALLNTFIGFAVVSVGNAAAYTFADNGPSVIAYSRLWFTFPYSFLAIPVATAMFTELSAMQADGDTKGVVRGILSGSSQIFFLMIPFAMYLIVFASPLVGLYRIGAFTGDAVSQIASYLAVMAVALPFYGVNTYIQMAFSSIRKMTVCSVIVFVASLLQIGVILASVFLRDTLGLSMEMIAVGTIVSYLVGDVLSFAYLCRFYRGEMHMRCVYVACVRAFVVGLAGAVVGGAVYYALDTFVFAASGNVLITFIYVVVAGCAALVVTFTPAVKRDWHEAAFVTNIWNKVCKLFRRR
ncbi:murein biosynthesis integral membrane protein MurJ [Adlercreutzia sp. ZJ154]|uniref:murein biosynthesis integral membrane protein MurJ n=1 Tax=Adlercreutzia sp. ZJ154 TaxID=2709790 RepID=UPI0013EBAC75|nr:murein biosynthesis integral membrane protein MurJ [Adlercreutzia sp. ZJ154]